MMSIRNNGANFLKKWHAKKMCWKLDDELEN
jgi:hypothetical protein